MPLTEVVLVDENDRPTGVMEKQEAHVKGALHRAITVYVFNSRQQLLLQQRAEEKYHSGGLWSNTCCSHPAPGEETLQAAHRRLYEEMGLRCALTPMFTLTYRLPLDNGLIEHELGHVYFGVTDDVPQINPDEVSNYAYQSIDEIAQRMVATPEQFTAWFQLTFARIPEYWQTFQSEQSS
ncbi:isopentenyl-diphosphate Delta-isomerase [Pectobacterium polaris]|uniref:Isopentenyl-diphosphate Delta-isomerase n=2 Tax=Pectobacterium polaris TaxID=2042057 RepID=A0AAW4NV83_9GAMM|nr:isopentenyl-diphosphate Delta-isomerase [Pectobacterium polaris]MBW5890971.1 isopentenyl-diphosphate Delta-isomerase [Pectobacterium polaris]MDG0801919.1 isopentenyl-diphosphate Delta-isomerase [Pectobacterium polaris]UAY90465.1 isopentenyl-diphosphate Delta-isomerase [Pectobacterium polaris]